MDLNLLRILWNSSLPHVQVRGGRTGAGAVGHGILVAASGARVRRRWRIFGEKDGVGPEGIDGDAEESAAPLPYYSERYGDVRPSPHDKLLWVTLAARRCGDS